MSHSLRLPIALALGSALALGACAPKNPPALPVPEAKPLVVPMPAPPKDPTLFAYLKLRDAKQTLDLFGASALAAQQGIKLEEVAAGKPAAIFAWDPQGADSPQSVPAVAVLPVPSQGTVAARLKGMAESIQVEPMGEGTLAAMNAGVGDKARANREALTDIMNAPLAFDGLLYVNAVPILEKYLPVLRKGVAAMEPMLAAASMGRKDGPDPKTTVATLDSMLNLFESLRAVAIGAKPYDGGIEVSALIEERKPTPGGPIAAPDLAQFLPAWDLRMVWNSNDLGRIIDFYLKMYGPMLDQRPELKAQLMPLIDEWMKISRRFESATSMSFGGEAGLRGIGLVRVEKPKEFLALVPKAVALFQAGPVHDLYKSMGVEFQITHQPRVRKLHGWPVDRYQYHVNVSPELASSPAASIWKMISNLSYEVVQLGPYILYGLNGSIDDVAKELFAGKGTHPMKATTLFPHGGRLYIDANVPALLSGVKSILPPNVGERLPSLPPQPDLLTIFSYSGDTTSDYRVRVPGLLIAAIRTAATTPNPPPGAPPQ